MSMRVVALLLFSFSVLFAQNTLNSADPVAKAQDLYNHTDYEASLRTLRDGAPSSPKAEYLAGRDYFMLGDYKQATESLQRAVSGDPSNAEYVLWLGRSYGRRAETASPFSAPKYASKARASFEKAVELDPKNQDALSDLFDYYLEAPGFLGGGYDKAQAVAKRMADLNPAEGHLAQAKLADRRKQFDTAEEQLRRAAEVAPHELGRLLDLARYLAKHGQTAESDAAFQKAAKLAPNSPRVNFVRAQTLIEQHRNLPEAKALLDKYLQSNLTADDPSRAQAEKLLKKTSGA